MWKGRLFIALFGALALSIPTSGSAQYFGRNKVQYRSFDFDIIRTEHFDIYYYKQERTAVMDAARVAERSYARLSRILQHEFSERKPIILYASQTDFQQTNALNGFIDESTGGVTEALKNRVILPFTGSYAEFDHVLTHELVHAFQFDIIMNDPVNETSPFNGRLPLWFMEGMAEYLSIGRIDPLTVSWLRDATLNGYLRDIRVMSLRDDYLSYRFGQSLWSYIGSKWGDEAIGVLLQKTTRMGLERAFSTTLGMSLNELSKEWVTNVRKTYLPTIADHPLPQTFAQKLTHHDRLGDDWFLSPAISPDGKRMVYLSQRAGYFFDLWLADANTGKPLKRLISAARDANFESLRYMTSGATFSPDGRFIAFAAQTGGRDALYIYDLDEGRVVHKLKYELDGIESPTYSPDGQQIAFVGLNGGISDLYITDLTGNLTQLTDDRYADLTPAWSPDGRTIAFATDRGPGTNFERLTYGNFRVALYDLTTGNQDIRVLPHQEHGKNFNPVWAPDGKSLVWVNDATGTNNLALFDLETQQLYRISDLLSGVLAIKEVSPVLSWARSGRLLFGYFENAGYNVYAVDDPRALPRKPMSPPAPVVAAGDGKDAPALPGLIPPAARDKLNAQPQTVAGDRTITLDKPPVNAAPIVVAPVTSFYRDGNGFRPSGQPLARDEAPAPVSVMALLDSATLALPDTAKFEKRDYKVHFSADVVGTPSVGTQVGGHYGSGLYGGSYVALSDMLGNHNILLAGNVNGSISDATFFTGYSFLKKRANLGASIEQIPLYRYYGGDYMTLHIDGQDQDVAANVFVRDVVRSASGFLSYPLSTFKRIELGVSGVTYQTDVLYRGRILATGEPLDHTERISHMSYVQPVAALVFDNSLFGWTGPIDGRRYRAQYSRTVGSYALSEALLDFRNYWNIKQKVVFATRLVGLARSGDDSDRFGVYWGGPYYLRGYDANSFNLDSNECSKSRFAAGDASLSRCPVRDQLIGSSAALLNLELRVPLIKELQIGGVGTFPPIDFVTFMDGGLAWDNEICLRTTSLDPRRCDAGQSQSVHVVWQRKDGQDPFLWRKPLFSYGAGLRINIFYTILRLDYAIPLDRPDRQGFRNGVFSLSFGPSF